MIPERVTRLICAQSSVYDRNRMVEVVEAMKEHCAQIAESWTPDQWEIHPREDFARKEIAAAIRRA